MVGFLRGILLGGVVAIVGLVAVSQLSGPVSGPADVPGQTEAGLAGNAPAAAPPAAPDQVAPDLTAQDQTAQDQTAPDQTAPDQTAPDQTAPDQTAPGQAAPDQTAPDQTAPDQTAPDQTAPDQTAPDQTAPDQTAPDAAAPQVAFDAPGVTGGGGTSEPPVLSQAQADAVPVATDIAAPTLGLEGDAPAAAASAPAEPPPQPPSTAPEGGRQVADAGASPALAPVTPPPLAAVAPSVPADPGGDVAPGPADLPPPPARPTVDEALLQPMPDAAPAADRQNPADPGPVAEDTPLAPSPALDDRAAGVVTDRLPRIGDPAPQGNAIDGAGDGSGDGAGDGAGDKITAEGAVPDAATDLPLDADLPPLQRHARVFAGAAGKPLFAILLEDTGNADVNRQELAALAIPLTIVIDPLSKGAADRAAIWRAGGQEVVMAASGIPAGARASDLEQTFQALAEALPEAVAVIDPDGRAFQDNRPLASQVVPILAGQGRGLVTFDRGLNAADQVARREKLGAATIFRRIDGEAEDAPVIRRYLDRAAFKAAQDGRVAVIGTLRPQTVAAILEWAVEGKSATVTLAPISALMVVDGG